MPIVSMSHEGHLEQVPCREAHNAEALAVWEAGYAGRGTRRLGAYPELGHLRRRPVRAARGQQPGPGDPPGQPGGHVRNGKSRVVHRRGAENAETPGFKLMGFLCALCVSAVSRYCYYTLTHHQATIHLKRLPGDSARRVEADPSDLMSSLPGPGPYRAIRCASAPSSVVPSGSSIASWATPALWAANHGSQSAS